MPAPTSLLVNFCPFYNNIFASSRHIDPLPKPLHISPADASTFIGFSLKRKGRMMLDRVAIRFDFDEIPGAKMDSTERQKMYYEGIRKIDLEISKRKERSNFKGKTKASAFNHRSPFLPSSQSRNTIRWPSEITLPGTETTIDNLPDDLLDDLQISPESCFLPPSSWAFGSRSRQAIIGSTSSLASFSTAAASSSVFSGYSADSEWSSETTIPDTISVSKNNQCGTTIIIDSNSSISTLELDVASAETVLVDEDSYTKSMVQSNNSKYSSPDISIHVSAAKETLLFGPELNQAGSSGLSADEKTNIASYRIQRVGPVTGSLHFKKTITAFYSYANSEDDMISVTQNDVKDGISINGSDLSKQSSSCMRYDCPEIFNEPYKNAVQTPITSNLDLSGMLAWSNENEQNQRFDQLPSAFLTRCEIDTSSNFIASSIAHHKHARRTSLSKLDCYNTDNVSFGLGHFPTFSATPDTILHPCIGIGTGEVHYGLTVDIPPRSSSFYSISTAPSSPSPLTPTLSPTVLSSTAIITQNASSASSTPLCNLTSLSPSSKAAMEPRMDISRKEFQTSFTV
ncbi:uncharacterized protein L203_105266 [Cryptococcus depauperatus CBS 7841]|uniref:Uncharacterized protein n=1 Tax=Cryptococcus depauperatus CBS 7841 TaxID=1295531 RepID=A0A1E3I0N6_9TREE|nr:hypothetical protein L203_05637 [Cryptococcus depauperatus CBS 7841]